MENTDTAEKKVEKVETKKEKRELNWLVTLIISLIFGSLGVDRFMLGQVVVGLLKLVTFGGFGIWWLVDVILIAIKYEFRNIEWKD
ncbi:MAG: TM2 domain-containing protein [Nanoarchaeota archaeon]|nr:TM2 domain-containing protein [Nanoarchaeota archaeon]